MKRGRKSKKGLGGVLQSSKRNTKKTATSVKNRKNTNSKGILKKIVYTVFVIIFILLIACLGIGAGMYAAITQEINEMNMQELALTRSSIVYYTDDNGNSVEAATLFSDGNSIWLESNEIPKVMKEAVVSIEDERFYDHNGIDIKRTAGAVFGYIKEKLGMGTATYGGSTITQQVIKNITQEKDRTPARKVKEMMRAIALEKVLSKDEILTMYLNIIFLANNCYGVEAASQMYFDKPASDLELHEAALIAGITQRPSYYDPLDNPENAVTKRNTVLAKMNELGKISAEEYEEAKNSDIGLAGAHASAKSSVYSYFVDNVINDVIRDLQTQKGYSETFAKQQVFGGGLKIYTTMDYDIQKAIEEVFENNSNFPSGASKAQAAMVIIDPNTGEIKGMVGGKGEKTDSRGLNRATQTTRQPGSSIKPLTVYTPAIEKGVVTPTTVIVDEPITIKDWEPKNSYTGFRGSMTVKKAIEISANIPAIKVVQELGVATSFDYAKNKFHLSTIADADKDLSPMALGGLTNGVTVEDMAAAYSVFANGGIYTKPYSYTKVLDSSNRVLLENDVESERVISEATAFIITDMLHSVVNGASGTGRLAKMSDVSVYGKTGTTNNDYDKWFVGYTKYYVGAVWFGFDTPSSIRNAGIRENISARLWKKVMENVHDDNMVGEILPSDNLVSAHICNITGELATAFCESSMQYFEKGTEPKVYCSATHYNINDEDPENPEGIPGETTDETQQSPDSQSPNGEQEPGDIVPDGGHNGDDIPEGEQNNTDIPQTTPTLNESDNDNVITLE